MNITLNEDQAEAVNFIHSFIENKKSHMMLFEGCAGVGKTTSLMYFIESYLESDKAYYGNICMSAPTNKAVKVMKEMCPPHLKNKITFCSLHSLLGLKHKITSDGREVFERDVTTTSNMHLYDIIIIDESSQIADQLFRELDEQNIRGTKIIFVGDRNQINPVNHEHSIPMLEHRREEFNIEHYMLTKIVRQAQDNPIIGLSQNVLKDEFKFEAGRKEIKDGSGICFLNKGQSSVLRDLFKYYFCNDTFDNNANHSKVVAWRNSTVDKYNEIIRALKYGTGVERIVKGEKLIVDRPIKCDSGDEIIFSTNEDLDTISVEIASKTVNDTLFYVYRCSVKGDNNNYQTIDILHEKSFAVYNQLLKKMAEIAKTESNIGNRARKWKEYFQFQENFAQVKYNYAITCHCAQGSTYTNCFVDYSDISLNRNSEERKRILYTAFTRPRNMLYIL